MNSTLQAVIVTLGIFALACLFGLIEALGGRRVWRRREEAERTRTTGVVVGFVEERHRYRSGKSLNAHYVTVYYPIVRFQADGVEYKLKCTSIVPRDKFQEDQAVDLLYDPNNPTHFHLDRGNMEDRSTRGAIIFAAVFLTCVVATIVVLLSVNHELKHTLYNAIGLILS